jgi:uncharacterized Zn-binding protein involved in type VI secretion
MGQPAARLTDMHACPMVTPGLPPIPHVGGPVVSPGCPTVLIGKLPAARLSDMCVCVGPPDVIVKGSATVLVGKLPAARIGDTTAHGGAIVAGPRGCDRGRAADGADRRLTCHVDVAARPQCSPRAAMLRAAGRP